MEQGMQSSKSLLPDSGFVFSVLPGNVAICNLPELGNFVDRYLDEELCSV